MPSSRRQRQPAIGQKRTSFGSSELGADCKSVRSIESKFSTLFEIEQTNLSSYCEFRHVVGDILLLEPGLRDQLRRRRAEIDCCKAARGLPCPAPGRSRTWFLACCMGLRYDSLLRYRPRAMASLLVPIGSTCHNLSIRMTLSVTERVLASLDERSNNQKNTSAVYETLSVASVATPTADCDTRH